MTDSSSTSRRPRFAPRFPGAILLVFPLLSLGIAIAWLQNRKPDLAGYPQAPEALEVPDVATWTGVSRGVNGARLRVQLTRLHPLPVRQKFEAQALGRRFEKPSGEPWQLEIEATPDWEGPIDLTELRIESEAALPLESLVRTATPAGNGIVDPVRVMFSVPDAMESGERRRFVVWGEEPSAQAVFRSGKWTVALRRDELPHVQGPLAERTASEPPSPEADGAEQQVIK